MKKVIVAAAIASALFAGVAVVTASIALAPSQVRAASLRCIEQSLDDLPQSPCLSGRDRHYHRQQFQL